MSQVYEENYLKYYAHQSSNFLLLCKVNKLYFFIKKTETQECKLKGMIKYYFDEKFTQTENILSAFFCNLNIIIEF